MSSSDASHPVRSDISGYQPSTPSYLCRCFKKVLKGMFDRLGEDRTARDVGSEAVHRSEFRMITASRLKRFQRLSPSNAISRDCTLRSPDDVLHLISLACRVTPATRRVGCKNDRRHCDMHRGSSTCVVTKGTTVELIFANFDSNRLVE